MRKPTMLFLLALACSIVAAGQDKHFKRVEKFPAGEQTRSIIGSFLSGLKDYNVVQYTFDAPYENVWPAVKRAARSFAKVGGRPVVAIDEDNSRVQNGRITQDAMFGMGPGAWIDEFIIEASKIGAKTKVAVSRKVIQKEFTGERPIKTQFSNSNIENYLLTQIEDEINKASAVPDAASVSASTDSLKSLAGKYVSNLGSVQFVDLKPDGTFYLQLSGLSASGKFEVADDVLTLVWEQMGGRDLRQSQTYRAKIQGDSITDLFGTTWVKQASANQATQDAEKTTARDGVRIDYSKSAPGKYINKNKANEYIELKPDGKFFLQEHGKGFAGLYDIAGDEITLVMTNGMAAKGKLRGGTLVDDEGQTWIKTGDSSQAPSPSSEVLTNSEVLRMVEAKLPDSVILAKIKNSRCKFDTSTDGLIKLKQAGVSDGVIAAMAEAGSK